MCVECTCNLCVAGDLAVGLVRRAGAPPCCRAVDVHLSPPASSRGREDRVELDCVTGIAAVDRSRRTGVPLICRSHSRALRRAIAVQPVLPGGARGREECSGVGLVAGELTAGQRRHRRGKCGRTMRG